MKEAIIILILFTICISPVSASEITGSISTNPNNLEPVIEEEVVEDEDDNNVEARHAASVQGGGFIGQEIKDIISEENNKVIVLGFSQYPDGSLVRSSDLRIYLIEGECKKYIKTLEELQKYSGQVIFDISDDVLMDYKTREHLNGGLIRQIGEVKIFHIVNGELEHILNLDELRAKFAGQEIFNIGREEMLLYRDF